MKPRRHVLRYTAPFADLVQVGKKRCTIRARRYATPLPGDVLDHRQWVGVPYRKGSTQRTMRQDACTHCATVIVREPREISLVPRTGDVPHTLDRTAADELARRDGFENADALIAYFASNYGLPFCGVLIEW